MHEVLHSTQPLPIPKRPFGTAVRPKATLAPFMQQEVLLVWYQIALLATAAAHSSSSPVACTVLSPDSHTLSLSVQAQVLAVATVDSIPTCDEGGLVVLTYSIKML